MSFKVNMVNILGKALDFQINYENRVKEAVNYLKKQLNEKPVFGLVLGSGLGELSSKVKNKKVIDYSKIPNFPKSKVPGHEGKLIIGNINDIPVIALKGRKHYYEVAHYPMNVGMLNVVFPVHVLASLGVENYFVTNSAGALNLKYKIGDIMLLKSHLSFLPNPLLGINYFKTELFQPMNSCYDLNLRKLFLKSNFRYKKNIHEGNYLAVTGPSYETEAECVFYRDFLKADAVGMSTVPEVIVARNRRMKVIGFSCITNVIKKDGTNATSHEEVQNILNSEKIKERLNNMILNFFKNY